jgi:hypothetical protein
MTFQEWCLSIVQELREAGLPVTVYAGFPLIKEPLTYEQRLRALDLRLSMPAERRIYSEGMLFIPRELHEMEL